MNVAAHFVLEDRYEADCSLVVDGDIGWIRSNGDAIPSRN
jgi:hypothetical protein